MLVRTVQDSTKALGALLKVPLVVAADTRIVNIDIVFDVCAQVSFSAASDSRGFQSKGACGDMLHLVSLD